MRSRDPIQCVQATVAGATARFRLWTEPAESDYEGSLDFAARAAAFRGTRRASGRVLQTVSLPDATFLREPDRPGWIRLHSARWRQGSWDPFGVLDVVAAVPALAPTEPAPEVRGGLQHHSGTLGAEAVARLADEAPARGTAPSRALRLRPAGVRDRAGTLRVGRPRPGPRRPTHRRLSPDPRLYSGPPVAG